MIEQLDKKFIQYLTRQGLVTQETLGTLIPFVTKRRKKKNYQEILSEYLNHLASAGNKLNSVSKEMKSQFFMNMNDMILNKNDELKYLILMREEFYKYKLKIYFFRKWKSLALYNHDLLDEDDPFQNNDVENYQNFKNMNLMIQGGTFNSKNSIDNSGRNNKNDNNVQSRIGDNPNLLIFDDEENKNKNNEIKLGDSIKVLDVQKNINNALTNTNDVFSKFNSINSNKENDNEINNKNENKNLLNRSSEKNEEFNNILNNIQRLKNNAAYGDKLEKNKIIGNKDESINRFNDLLIKNDDNKNNDINLIQNPKNLFSLKNQKLDGKSLNKKGEKISKNSDINNKEVDKSKSKNKNKNKFDIKNKEEDINKSKSKSKDKFDIKKLYKYKAKNNLEDDEEKYKNSKYISTKFKDYLHSGDKIFNTKKSNSKQKNKLNDLYKELQKNLEHDETLLRRLELKREISSQNIRGKNSRSKSKNQREKSSEKLNNNEQRRIFMNYDNTKNFEENLLKNGFFSGKNKKNNNENEEENEEIMPEKIKEIMEKYQNDDINKEKIITNKKGNKNYDYIKKIKASEQGPDINYENRYIPNYKINIKSKRNENDFDDEYDELFHPKNIRRNNINNYNQLNTSDYSNSVYNILNNLNGYDNVITDINEPKYTRITKRRIERNPRKEKKERKSYLNSDFFENSRSSNTSYILAPMKNVPITNISFRARMKYFSDKKQKNLEKMLKAKKEEEKQIYTFQPKTGENKLNVIKYDNYVNKENANNKKRMPDYNRINNLYLDYKDKKNKLNELTREYYKKAGISFTPMINDKNKEIKEFKNKIGQIPYLDRIDIYNASKQNYNNKDKFNFIPTEIY